jgi:hypothetical protein
VLCRLYARQRNPTHTILGQAKRSLYTHLVLASDTTEAVKVLLLLGCTVSVSQQHCTSVGKRGCLRASKRNVGKMCAVSKADSTPQTCTASSHYISPVSRTITPPYALLQQRGMIGGVVPQCQHTRAINTAQRHPHHNTAS